METNLQTSDATGISSLLDIHTDSHENKPSFFLEVRPEWDQIAHWYDIFSFFILAWSCLSVVAF